MNRYISDLHFGHKNILRFDNRPFFDTQEMEQKLISNWNSVVRPGDTTYILGDFCWSKDDSEWIRLLDLLNGSKVLIRGNHDIQHPSPLLRKKFADIKDYKEIKDCGKRVIMSHYPMLLHKAAYNPDCIMLCGHIHTTRENEFLKKWRNELEITKSNPGDACGKVINVGCMLPYMDYTPKALVEILRDYKEEV